MKHGKVLRNTDTLPQIFRILSFYSGSIKGLGMLEEFINTLYKYYVKLCCIESFQSLHIINTQPNCSLFFESVFTNMCQQVVSKVC